MFTDSITKYEKYLLYFFLLDFYFCKNKSERL